MPSMIFIGEREQNQKRGNHTISEFTNKIYKNLSPPKYMLEIKDANHFSFNNGFNERSRKRGLSGTDEHFEVIRRYAIAFLESHVAERKDLYDVLKQGDSMITRYITETVPDAFGQSKEKQQIEKNAPADMENPQR